MMLGGLGQLFTYSFYQSKIVHIYIMTTRSPFQTNFGCPFVHPYPPHARSVVCP